MTLPHYEDYGIFFKNVCGAINDTELFLKDLYMTDENDKHLDEYQKSRF